MPMTTECATDRIAQTSTSLTAVQLFEPIARAAQRLAYALQHPQTEDILAAWQQLKVRMESQRYRV